MDSPFLLHKNNFAPMRKIGEGVIMTTLSINFYSATINEALKNEFMQAINHELAGMNIESLNDSISRLEKQASSIQKDIDDNGDDEAGTKQKKLDGINATIADNKDARTKCEKSQAQTLDIYNKVVSAMSEKNKDHFGNNKDVVRTVLRVLATWDNSKLVKYAIIPAFQSPALYEALEAIHINSKAGEDGNITMSKEVKDAYKKASQELETIIKTTFSLPFETPYTDKTRVKLTAEDKKLLNDCYVRGFSNKFDVDDKKGTVTFKDRQINTLVKAKKNRKTGDITYDYSGLASTIANIVIKHYFA